MNHYLSNAMLWLHYFRIPDLVSHQMMWAKEQDLPLSIEERKMIDFLRQYNFCEAIPGHWDFISELYQQGREVKNVENYHHIKIRFESYQSLRIGFAICGEFIDLKPQNGSWIELGYDDPHFHLPVFRWEEVQLLTQYKETVLENRHFVLANFDIKYLPLLLLKLASYETANLADYKAFLLQELENIAVFPQDEIPYLAELIIKKWFPKEKQTTYKWRKDDNLGWVNNFRYSNRNPENEHLKIKDFQKIQHFFFTVEQATKFRKHQQRTTKCSGYLGGSHRPFLNDNIKDRRVCCDNLVCFHCHYPIKTWDGYWVAPHALSMQERKILYECDNPDGLPFVRKKSFNNPRLYACRCWADGIASFDQLGYYEGTASWECGGH